MVAIVLLDDGRCSKILARCSCVKTPLFKRLLLVGMTLACVRLLLSLDLSRLQEAASNLQTRNKVHQVSMPTDGALRRKLEEGTTPSHLKQTTKPDHLEQNTTRFQLEQTTTPDHLEQTTKPDHLGQNTTRFQLEQTTTPYHLENTTTHLSTSENSTNSNNSISINNTCPAEPPNLVGSLAIVQKALDMEAIEATNPTVLRGGLRRPSDCVARHKVAIVIPYRDREEHLRVFLAHMHPLLTRQQLDYGIFVVEQAGTAKFNRAMLFNIGFMEALERYDFNCFVFHDVDLLPEDDRNVHNCSDQPRHMSAAINIFNYKVPYETIFGGVSALSTEQFWKLDGFSNAFWGWGGEDDDMANRVRYYGYRISRYPLDIARYTMLGHSQQVPEPNRYEVLDHGESRFGTDGLVDLNYEVTKVVSEKLYTKITVVPLCSTDSVPQGSTLQPCQ